MADKVSAIKTQRLVSPPTKQNPPTPGKIYSHFLFRASIAIIFFVIIIPFPPSITPEFLNQALVSEIWELLHVVFVGIAVSYGLFSRRSDDSGGEIPSKLDSAQSFVSGLLQVSSDFDEKIDSSTESFDYGGKNVQTWSSMYFRNEPAVVVAKKEGSGVFSDEKADSISRVGDDRPLLLPVRSLKSRVSDKNGVADSRVSGRRFDRSRSSGSISLNGEKKIRHRSLKSRVSDANGVSGYVNREFELPSSASNGGLCDDIDGNDLILPSPIPWRSRSGRMEINEDVEDPPPMEMNANRSSVSQSSQSSHLSSASSPSKVFPSQASLLDSEAKRSEDLARWRTIYRSSPPLAPPLMKSNSSMANNHEDSDLKLSVWTEPKELSAGEMEKRSKVDFLSTGKSARTIRSGHANEDESDCKNETQDSFERDVARSNGNNEDESKNEAENGKEEVAASVSASCSGVDAEGPDVDKKADEFIAKFREQIRLQRIDSIKRSTGQFSRSNVW